MGNLWGLTLGTNKQTNKQTKTNKVDLKLGIEYIITNKSIDLNKYLKEQTELESHNIIIVKNVSNKYI